MEFLTGIDEGMVALGGIVGLVVLVVAVRIRRRRTGNLGSISPDRFNTLAARAGGKVTAERLVAGELSRGAGTRHKAVEKALERLANDRRSWR